MNTFSCSITKQISSSISLRCDIYENLAGGHQFNLSALADSADKIMYYLVYHDSEYQLDEYMKLADKDGINDNWFIYSEKGYVG